ncbi:UPF0193 protein EVG1 homolog isoform X2 [Eupeodes corollae]|uniref:UPF0193 protein EVG1 homolog isoform X2 n=1 Tax=Eupeodes corollae TaxID=290404 RepID=UPI002493495E|nr:UPF0193 protein EVG1 homolog isoform X2 [Eupeodes corollae]
MVEEAGRTNAEVLMEESKLSMQIRKQINYHLRNGDPLPARPPPIKTTPKNMDDNTRALYIIQKARAAKKKSLNSILASGAYEMPRYRPNPDGKMPSNKAKLKLQEVMSGIRHSEVCLKPKKRPEQIEEDSYDPEDLINELLDQINERADWLAEMEELGEGKKYRDDIKSQIADRLRKIKMLEKQIELKKQGYRFVE